MKDYISKALRTESRVDRRKVLINITFTRLLHASMGLCTESGELLDALKKHIFYGKELDKVNLVEEMGDVFWYLAILADVLGVNFEDVMRCNISKLEARYGSGFSKERALKRNIKKEIQALKRSSNVKKNAKDSRKKSPA